MRFLLIENGHWARRWAPESSWKILQVASCSQVRIYRQQRQIHYWLAFVVNSYQEKTSSFKLGLKKEVA